MTKADRDYFLSIGICPTCKKNKIYANEKECEPCSQWRYVFNRRVQQGDRAKYNEYQKQYHVKRQERLKSQGLCTRCGKRKIAVERSISRCEICLEKQRRERCMDYREKKKREWETKGEK